MQFVMTEEGDKQLKAALDRGPRQYWTQRHGTFDSLHRAIFLAWVASRPEDAKGCIAEAVEILRRKAGRNELDVGDLRKTAFRLRDEMLNNEELADDSILITTVYRWIGAEMDAVEYKLQAETLHVLDTLVADLPPAPKIWPEIPRAQQTSP